MKFRCEVKIPEIPREAAEKAKMAQAEEAQRAEVARLMETLTPAQAGQDRRCSALVRPSVLRFQVLHVLGEMQRLTLRAPDDSWLNL